MKREIKVELTAKCDAEYAEDLERIEFELGDNDKIKLIVPLSNVARFVCEIDREDFVKAGELFDF